eukprot:COSAG01_NODE_840_length_13184_cov_18.465724_7_plen_61_part_00
MLLLVVLPGTGTAVDLPGTGTVIDTYYYRSSKVRYYSTSKGYLTSCHARYSCQAKAKILP